MGERHRGYRLGLLGELRSRNRLLVGLASAASLAALAGVLWLIAVGASWGRECPGPIGLSEDGLDKNYSAWPPGAECVVPPSRPGPFNEVQDRRLQEHTYVYEAAPGLKWPIAGLGVSAAAVLLVGLVAEGRELARRTSMAGGSATSAGPR
jgi:hypothetical protein